MRRGQAPPASFAARSIDVERDGHSFGL
jgi:hypothetical protein